MTYVMSDLHGRYDRYTVMLEKIKFSDSDTLYVLGDSIDGDGDTFDIDIIGLLKDMMSRKNVINLQGNHELWAMPFLRPLKNIDFSTFDINDYRHYYFGKVYCRLQDWLGVGGMATFEQLISLPQNEIAEFVDYIDSWGFYKDITVGENRYILSHAGLYEPDTPLDVLPYIGAEEWTFSIDLDYNERYFPGSDNIYLVTGHITTERIHFGHAGKIYRNQNHIAVDTGTDIGWGTGCICLDTGEEFYIYNPIETLIRADLDSGMNMLDIAKKHNTSMCIVSRIKKNLQPPPHLSYFP